MERELGQLSSDQLKVRQIANYYLEVENSTEPLSQLVRFNPKARRIPLSGKMPIEMRSFFHLIVQLTYLLYTCLLKRANLFLGGEMLARVPRRGESIPYQDVYVEYILDKEYNWMPKAQQEMLARKFRFIELTKADNVFGEFVCEFISKIKNMIKGPLQKAKSTSSESHLHRQMEGLTLIIESFIQPQIKSMSPQVIMLCLEESELFRDLSLLLKAFNNSIFVAIRYFPGSNAIYNELLALEEKYILRERSKAGLMDYMERVETLIEESFRMLLMNKIISTEHSLEQLQDEKQTSKKYVLGSLKGNSVESRKYAASIFVNERPFKPFTEESLKGIKAVLERMQFDFEKGSVTGLGLRAEGLKEKDKGGRNECVVEFYSSKNMLVVKYVTSIELNLQNTDLLMFHCNYLSQGWEGVSLQFHEKNISKSKKKEKYLAFKTSSYINQQQRLLFKILTMIDMLTLHAKIVEPQLRKSIYALDDYEIRNADLTRKCSHINSLFLQKIEKSYITLHNSTRNS